MKTLVDINNIVTLVVGSASLFDGVKKILLFGSYARNEANIQSDVDIAIVHKDDVCPAFGRDLKRKFYLMYDGDIEVQFTFLSETAFAEDKHVLNVARSVREEGIVLWQK